MFHPEEFIQEYQQLAHGTPRLRVMKKAIAAADEAKSAEWQFIFRHRYVHESVFEGDDLDALIVFPEMLAVYDKNPELAEEHQRTLMWDFKNILGNLPDFSQLPLAEIEKLLSEFESRCKKYGYSMHTPRYIREKISVLTANFLPLSEYGKFAEEPEDGLKDCTACEASFKVKCALLRGDRAKAEKLSEPLFERRVTCAEIPEETYAHWIDYLREHGDYGKARQYAKILYPMVQGRMEILHTIAAILRLYAVIDHHTACNIFRRELHLFLDCRNQWKRMLFAVGAYKLFSRMEQREIVLLLPQSFPLFSSESTYDTGALRDYFYQEALAIAKRLDNRNGNDYYTALLAAEDPEYDEEAVDLVYGYAEQEVSALAAVCKTLPEGLTPSAIAQLLESDGRMHVELMRADPDGNILQFQITEDDQLFRIGMTVQPVCPIDEFRPVTPVAQSVSDAAAEAEGMIVCVMPFEEIEPDIALHFQMKFIQLICPDAVVYLDLTRRKLLDARWMAMEAYSQVPPLVDYLYHLSLYGGQNDDSVWITTVGLRCCSIRDIEIFDATKENFARFCDFVCFAAERILLRGEMPDAGTPFTVLRKADNTPVVCAWLPVSQALAYYPENDPGCTISRQMMLGEDADSFSGNAVLFLYDGENADGSTRLKRLSTLTEEDFQQFCYGQFIATSRKISAWAKERYDIFLKCFEQHPEDAYACIHFENEEEEEEEIWVKVTAADNNRIVGQLTDDCLAGQAGTEFTAPAEDICNFSLRNQDIFVQPNTAYLGEID